MKKIVLMMLALTMVFALAACGETENTSSETASTATSSTESVAESATESSETETSETSETSEDEVKVMSHEEYMAAEMDSEVVVETYVQAHQSWWDNKITVYCQSEDGAYFAYEMACTEEDAAKLVPGTKIRITGYKGAFEGEIEIMDGTFEFVEGDDTYIAEAFDATELLGTDELIDHQNEFVKFEGLTVSEIEYKNGEPGDDIYLTLTKGDVSVDFCVEIYLTGEDTEVYTTVGTLEVGNVVNVEGFLYWYQGANPHITSISVAE